MKNGIEWQVSSLGPSKRLKELGVKQESVCYWAERYQLDDIGRKVVGVRFSTNPDFSGTTYSYFHEQDICAAFTVAELGEMLWNGFETAGWGLLSKAYGDVFGFPGTERIGELGIVNLMRKPNMAAKMLIYLIEQKLITV